MVESDKLRYSKMALSNGSGAIPALGFGTLIPDPVATRVATKAALETGFRQLDASERYRNEKEVGDAMQEVFKAGKIKREEVFIATEVSNNIVLNASNPPSRPVSRNSSSTTSISISFTPPLPSNLETTRIRGTQTAM
jgi:diketogulonate reductase-like aldo/keto reductase